MSCWSDLGWYSALEKLRPRRVSDTLNPPALLTDSNYRNQIRSHAALRALRKNRYHDLCARLVWCITWFRVFQTCPHWEGWKPSSPGFDLQLGCICGPLLNNRCCTQNKDPFQVPIWQSQKMLLSFIFWRVIKKNAWLPVGDSPIHPSSQRSTLTFRSPIGAGPVTIQGFTPRSRPEIHERHPEEKRMCLVDPWCI